jgi:ketosteroid isomerase-like protein
MPRMRRAAPLFTLLLLLAIIAPAQETTPAPDTPEQQIGAVLRQQVEAWNHGDLKGYMAGYWNSPDLTFFSGGTITKGWQSTLDRYRKRYQSGGREMGKLDFSETSVEMLGPESAVARGRWRLAMKNGQQPKGLFTVIFRKFPDGWRIIHDHSSAE